MRPLAVLANGKPVVKLVGPTPVNQSIYIYVCI